MNAPPAGLGAKLALRLIAPLMVLFVLNSLDRVNVSFGALQMNAALGLTPEAYGFGVSIFFLGYILLQYSHLWVERKIGARLWILIAAVFWGAVATAMAFITNATQFYVLRFFLGVAEAGFAPGVVLYMATFVPRQFRGLAIAGAMLAIPVSVIIGGPISGWLMTDSNPLSLPGWRWMFLVEGLVTLALALFAYVNFRDRPEDVSWLTEQDKSFVREELERDSRDGGGAPGRRVRILASPRTWAAAIAHFGLLAGSYTLIFWLPQALKRMSSLNPFEVGVVAAAPWAAFATGMMLNAWRSDRSQERYWHFTIAAVCSAAALAAAATVPSAPMSFGLLVLAALFMGGGQGTFWPIPVGFMKGPAAPLGLAVVNMAGNFAGVVTPPVIGWIVHETGSFRLPIYVMGSLMGLSAMMIPLIARLSAADQAETRTVSQTV